MATKTITMNRDAGTGQLVKASYAATHPKTTVIEHRKVPTPPPPKPSTGKKVK